ncbi:unnamed protein product [Adineta ricciae]|uniref:G-protein coupled receptors family 1 profile domain-containing protein n=1 Tax=Adineta ricciae TaxID=249248 RepID=A0A815QYP4_ADIRI|nr:unnamed protein product [Adineta ricciae]CAF1470095.1 unnamed protein product [Adineta ricciae]
MDTSNANSVIYEVKFIILITLQIPGILLMIFIFLFFTLHPYTLKKLQNQALFILLITNSIRLIGTMPMPIDFYRRGYIFLATSAYCTCWTFLEYSLAVIGEYLMATISVQRHVTIFHPNIFQTFKKSILFFYLPLAFSVAYPIIFYVYAVLLYPCDGAQWDYSIIACGYMNCYYNNNKLAVFDWVVHNILPIVVIILANVTLITRVIVGKLRRNQAIHWRQQRTMTLQLLSISSLYVVAWSPTIIVGLIQQATSINFGDVQAAYITDLIYLSCLLLPWVCLGQLPEFRKWMWKYMRWKRVKHASIAPL